MKRIIYAGGEYLTGDEIARALIGYGEALAEVGGAKSIDIPIALPDGTRSSATFLVGPASQIVAQTAPSDGDEIVDRELVQKLENLTRQLHPTGGIVTDEEPFDFEDFDRG